MRQERSQIGIGGAIKDNEAGVDRNSTASDAGDYRVGVSSHAIGPFVDRNIVSAA